MFQKQKLRRKLALNIGEMMRRDCNQTPHPTNKEMGYRSNAAAAAITIAADCDDSDGNGSTYKQCSYAIVQSAQFEAMHWPILRTVIHLLAYTFSLSADR